MIPQPSKAEQAKWEAILAEHDLRMERGRDYLLKHAAEPKTAKVFQYTPRPRIQGTPAHRARVGRVSSQFAAKPEWRKKISESTRQTLTAPGMHEKISTGVKRSWTPERRKQQAERLRKRWKDPVERNKLRANTWENSEFRERHKAGVQRLWADADFRRRHEAGKAAGYARRAKEKPLPKER